MSDSRIAELLGVSDATLGAVFLVAWVLAFVVTAYRYRRGTYTRAEYLLWSGGSLMWIAFSLGLVGRDLTGTAALAVDLLYFGAAVVAVGFFVQWWRVRKPAGESSPG